jgi:single-stranded DNA-binding protein
MTDKTSWFRITSFNPSDYVRERVKKGALVFVDGDVSLDKYQDEASGKTLTSIRIVQSTFLLFSCVASC